MANLGYEIEPHEVDTLINNRLADILAEPDDLTRYHALTREQALYDALVSAIKRKRGEALAKLAEGRTARQVAAMTGLRTRQRVEQLIAARIVPNEGEPTMPATDTEHAHLIATVIAVAREDFIRSAKGQTTAGFDYGLAGGSEHAERSLQNALYQVANRGHDTSNADECEARWRQLAVDLAADLDAFRAKCRGRKYTGWSMASSGPIRYAG